MRRTQIYLDDDQDRLLTERAKSTGSTKSALIRDAIDAFLADGSNANAAGIERLRSAVAGAAGVAPYLPSGNEYVNELRAADSERERELSERRGQ